MQLYLQMNVLHNLWFLGMLKVNQIHNWTFMIVYFFFRYLINDVLTDDHSLCVDTLLNY